MKQVLGDKLSGWLESSTEEVNRFLQDTLSNPMWGQDLIQSEGAKSEVG